MSPRQKEPLTYEHALLGFLLETPMHAYALHLRIIHSPLGQVWHIKQSALYAMITRLQELSYITVSADTDDARGKRYLSITDEGVAIFRIWCQSPVDHLRDIRIEFLAKLYFTLRCYPNLAPHLLNMQHRACLSWLAQLSTPKQTESYITMVYTYRRGQIEAALRWIEECRQLAAE